MATKNTFRLRYQIADFSDGSESIEFGLINEVKFTAKPIELGKDSYGRTVSGGYDIKAEFNLMASDNETLKNIVDKASNMGSGTLKFKGTGGDIQIDDVLLMIEMDLSLDGKPSKAKVSFDRFMTESQFSSVFQTSETVVVPSIIGSTQ